MSWAPFENSEGLEWCVRILPTVLSPPCSPMHLDVTLATAALISLLQLRSSAPAQGSLNLYLSLSLTHTPSLFLQNSHGVFVSGGETKKKATQKSPSVRSRRARITRVTSPWRQLRTSDMCSQDGGNLHQNNLVPRISRRHSTTRVR